jgi:hypothetical protein
VPDLRAYDWLKSKSVQTTELAHGGDMRHALFIFDNQYIRVVLHLFFSPLFIVEYVKEVGKRGGISG